MVEVQKNHALTAQETEVLDDIADLVREERRQRFEFKNSTERGAGTAGWHKANILQLRRMAEMDHYKFLKDIYIQYANLGDKMVAKIEAVELSK